MVYYKKFLLHANAFLVRGGGGNFVNISYFNVYHD